MMRASDHPGRWADITSVAMATWLGVHAVRTFLAMVVWNIGEDRPPSELGLIALSIWVIGLLAWPVARLVGGPRPEVRLGALFLLVYIASQFVAHPVLTPALGAATAVCWLWFLPALIIAIGRRGAAHTLVPGILLGLAGQVSLQTALHGMDMPMLRGFFPGLYALVLGAIAHLSLRAGAIARRPGSREPALAQSGAWPGWGLAALGPFLVLQLTLLANLGRVQTLAGWDLPAAAALTLLGLIAGCAALLWTPPYPVRAAAAVLAVVLLAQPAWLHGSGVWLLVVVQALLSLSTAAALRPVPGGRFGRVYAWFVAAAMLLFVLTFVYYSHYGWPALWPVMAALSVLPALAPASTFAVSGVRLALAAAVLVALLGVRLGLMGRGTAVPAADPAPVELTIMTYNIHEGFNFWSVPDSESIARVIDASGADLIGLQEVGRGWNINGGPDLVSWLRWRLPQYRVVYAPMLGDLVGDVILSRYPVGTIGWMWYPARKSTLHYGLMWATIPTAAGELLFVNTHLSPYPQFQEDRAAQAADLLAFWKERPRTVIVGDFNAQPDEASIRRLMAGRLLDVPARHQLGTALTFSSGKPYERIDYIFASPDLGSLSASIPQTTASDHLPVQARMKMR